MTGDQAAAGATATGGSSIAFAASCNGRVTRSIICRFHGWYFSVRMP